MGTRIENVDIEGLKRDAQKISQTCSLANGSVNNAYAFVNEMKQHWYGLAYDGYAAVLNQNVKALNSCFRYLVEEAPDELVAKALDYAEMNDGAGSGNVSLESAVVIKEIELSGKGAEYRFMEDDVEASRQAMNRELDAATRMIYDAAGIVNSLPWAGDAATSTINQMKTDINAVKAMMEDMNTAYSNAIQAVKVEAAAKEAGKTVVQAGEATLNTAKEGMEAAKRAAEEVARKADEKATEGWTKFKAFLSGGL